MTTQEQIELTKFINWGKVNPDWYNRPGMTIDDVAKASGCTVRTVYRATRT